MRVDPSTSFWCAQLASSVGISCKVVIQLRSTPGKCLKGVQRAMLKVVRWYPLEGLCGENEGIKGVKIGIVSKRKNGPASEKARTRHIRQCRARQGMGNLTREMRNLSGYAKW